jgi:phosphoserine/homoserine phosphotransferase
MVEYWNGWLIWGQRLEHFHQTGRVASTRLREEVFSVNALMCRFDWSELCVKWLRGNGFFGKQERAVIRRGREKTARHAHGVLENSGRVKQSIVTLDMEGVLTPEIWIAVAEKTGIPELRRTTREEPDYDKLMRQRIAILNQHGIKLSEIQKVIGSLSLLDGAKAFLDDLRTCTQVLILSDTFEQFAAPLIRQLNWPTLLCHKLVVADDRIKDYQLRVPDQKKKAVMALKLLNYKVVAAGDSFNDTAMLIEADTGFLFHAPPNVTAQFPQFPAVNTYTELSGLLKGALN